MEGSRFKEGAVDSSASSSGLLPRGPSVPSRTVHEVRGQWASQAGRLGVRLRSAKTRAEGFPCGMALPDAWQTCVGISLVNEALSACRWQRKSEQHGFEKCNGVVLVTLVWLRAFFALQMYLTWPHSGGITCLQNKLKHRESLGSPINSGDHATCRVRIWRYH